MKKAIVLLLALAVVGGYLFAQDAAPAGNGLGFTVTGSAGIVAGYDLDAKHFGFENSTSATVKVPIYKSSASKGGEGTYGLIKIDNFDLRIENGAFTKDNAYNGSISGFIVSGPITFGLGNPGLSFDYASPIAAANDVNAKGLANTGGFSLEYNAGVVDITAMLGSVGSYRAVAQSNAVTAVDPVAFFTKAVASADAVSAVTQNVNDEFIAGVKAVIKPADAFALEAMASLDLNNPVADNQFTAFGGVATLKFAPITVSIPFDAVILPTANANGGFSFDTTPALTVALGDNSLTGSASYLSMAKPASSNLDAKVAFTEADGDKGFLPAVGATVSAELDHLTGTLGYTVEAKANVNISDIVPAIDVVYSNAPKLTVDFSVTAGKLIPNTSLKVEWASGNLQATPAVMGLFTLSATVSL